MTTQRITPEAETAASSLVVSPWIDQPTKLSTDLVANRAGALRSDVGILSADVANAHSESLLLQLRARTQEAAKRSPSDLLSELSALGFAWTAVARLVGVSVPAVRKWRQGESVSGDNRARLAQLVAFVGVLARDHLVADVASWLEIPISESPFTGVDVYAAGDVGALMEYASEHLRGPELLDRVIADWRQALDPRFEVFTSEDGQRGLRLREVRDQ